MNDRSAAEALRVLLVDDEAPARARLRLLIGECADPPVCVAGEAPDAAQALAWLAAHRCDVVLLDIALPARSGLALAADLRARCEARQVTPPAIVFVTAHADHALQAFDLEAVDYLTKPVRRERLQAALQRVAQRRRPVAWQDERPSTAAIEPAGAADVLVVTDRGRLLRIPVAEVLYLKAELKYVTVRTAGGSHVLDAALGDLAQRLGDGFLRIHRNALVARAAVRALERHAAPAASTGAGVADDDTGDEGDGVDGWSVRLAGIDDALPVSRRLLPAVRTALRAAGR